MYNWRNILTFVVAGLIALVVIISLFYGIIKRPGDLGFRVKDGHELKWRKDKLPIICIYRNIDEKLLAAYNHAVFEILNPTLRFSTYMECIKWKLPVPPPKKDLLLLEYRETGKPGGDTTILYNKKNGEIYGLHIRIEKNVEHKMLLRIMTHELLHGLGLEHDREKTIMFRKPKPWEMEINISRRDIKLLQKTYK